MMKNLIKISCFFLLTIPFMLTIPLSSCDKHECDDDQAQAPCDTCVVCDTCIYAMKPNIYLYPEQQIDIDVEISFPKGGKVVKSIPEYKEGWSVNIESNGKIDRKWTYLFYESIQPNQWQYDKGWVVKKKDLSQFFVKNMTEYGFSKNEIADFTTHWIPRLNDDEYIIYPQTNNTLDKLIQLKFSTEPDKILRLFYFVEPLTSKEQVDQLEKPTIDKSFNRTKFFVTEWGVLMKNDLSS